MALYNGIFRECNVKISGPKTRFFSIWGKFLENRSSRKVRTRLSAPIECPHAGIAVHALVFAQSSPQPRRKCKAQTGADGELSLLERTDRGNNRRRGTDLVRVQQARALSKGGRKQSSIYLSELGPRRLIMQLKWFISTIIVAASGLAIIGAVLYSSSNSPSHKEERRLVWTLGWRPNPARKPNPAKRRSVSIGLKTDRLVTTSKGWPRATLYRSRSSSAGARGNITPSSPMPGLWQRWQRSGRRKKRPFPRSIRSPCSATTLPSQERTSPRPPN